MNYPDRMKRMERFKDAPCITAGVDMVPSSNAGVKDAIDVCARCHLIVECREDFKERFRESRAVSGVYAGVHVPSEGRQRKKARELLGVA